MNTEKGHERHAFDSWEVLKIVLDQNPSLKQRVFSKIRELRAEMKRKGRPPAGAEPVDAKEKKK